MFLEQFLLLNSIKNKGQEVKVIPVLSINTCIVYMCLLKTLKSDPKIWRTECKYPSNSSNKTPFKPSNSPKYSYTGAKWMLGWVVTQIAWYSKHFWGVLLLNLLASIISAPQKLITRLEEDRLAMQSSLFDVINMSIAFVTVCQCLISMS